MDSRRYTEGESTHRTVTFAEIAAMEKRRKKRRKYAKDKQRGRSSGRVTYTDELRSLIETQMGAWEAFLKENLRRTAKRETTVKRLK